MKSYPYLLPGSLANPRSNKCRTGCASNGDGLLGPSGVGFSPGAVKGYRCWMEEETSSRSAGQDVRAAAIEVPCRWIRLVLVEGGGSRLILADDNENKKKGFLGVRGVCFRCFYRSDIGVAGLVSGALRLRGGDAVRREAVGLAEDVFMRDICGTSGGGLAFLKCWQQQRCSLTRR